MWGEQDGGHDVGLEVVGEMEGRRAAWRTWCWFWRWEGEGDESRMEDVVLVWRW